MTTTGTNGHTKPAQRAPIEALHAERALLGCLLHGIEEAIVAAVEACQPDDFYRPAHAHIYDAIVDLDARGRRIDAQTVWQHLVERNLADTVGGAQTLTDLMADAPGMGQATAAHWAGIVADTALLRRLQGSCLEVAHLAPEHRGDIIAFVDQAQQRILDAVARRSDRTRATALADAVAVYLERIEEMRATGDVIGVPTGWHDVDNLLGGLSGGQLITVAARPGMGKSDWACTLAVNVGASAATPVLMVSLEMSTEELTGRLVALTSKVDRNRLRSAGLVDRDWERIGHAMPVLTSLPVYIDDYAASSLAAIRHSARRVAAVTGRQPVVIVDYLQLVNTQSRENRQVEVAEIARGLKHLAKGLDTPVVALAQLSRNVEMRGDKRPMLSDLRESGEIEQASDVVIFLYRDEYYDRDSPNRGIAEVIVAKQRNGPTGKVDLAYLPAYGAFSSMTRAAA